MGVLTPDELAGLPLPADTKFEQIKQDLAEGENIRNQEVQWLVDVINKLQEQGWGNAYVIPDDYLEE